MESTVFLSQNKLTGVTPEMVHWVESVLPQETHPERAQSFLLSRLALKQALESVMGHVVPLEKLTLTHHHQLRFYPDYFVSLSHTKEAAMAWVRTTRGHGIDLERADRVLKDSILERIRHTDDNSALSPIELWCLKEAAFKALFNAGHISGPIAFKEIRFEQEGKWQWREISGHSLISLEDEQWQVAKAWF
ncbi:MAG: 4'-phosphopantetheinyl transferase family protein [Bacteriovoracaceae bacterium]